MMVMDQDVLPEKAWMRIATTVQRERLNWNDVPLWEYDLNFLARPCPPTSPHCLTRTKLT